MQKNYAEIKYDSKRYFLFNTIEPIYLLCISLIFCALFYVFYVIFHCCFYVFVCLLLVRWALNSGSRTGKTCHDQYRNTIFSVLCNGRVQEKYILYMYVYIYIYTYIQTHTPVLYDLFMNSNATVIIFIVSFEFPASDIIYTL